VRGIGSPLTSTMTSLSGAPELSAPFVRQLFRFESERREAAVFI
jgi:hypothetical protein